jgi:hypothetical protein
MATLDRRAAVLASTHVNGIDFVEVANTAQTLLRVHFLNAVNVQGTLTGAPTISGGETIPTVAMLPIGPGDWGWDDGHAVLTLRVSAPGDFSDYTLLVPSPVLDAFFAQVTFSFKAGCPSDLDCATPATACPPVTGNAPPIDYLAKDFLSFRQALLDFSTLRYPAWQERSEADFGVMFLEALSAVADDLSYTQDRIANEASLLTATQRVSTLRHARLVDYEPTPAVGATTWLQFEVAAGVAVIAHHQAVMAGASDGTVVTFETGRGLGDASPPPVANHLWNRAGQIVAYWFDDSQQCLPAGATSMYVLGRGYDFQPGQMLLIETAAESTADPPIRQIVHLLPPGDPAGPWTQELCDELFLSAVTPGPPFMTCPTSPIGMQGPTAVTMIAWQAADALTAARDLTRTRVIGNIAYATQGRTAAEVFAVRPPPSGVADAIAAAVERTGPRPLTAPGNCGTAPAIRLYTLGNAPLTWLPQPALDPSGAALPETTLSQTQLGAPGTLAPTTWSWFRSLLQAGAFDNAFTIDPAAYRTLRTNSDGTTQSDYDSDAGATIRFGDGVFGANPDAGMQFTVTYRYGAGAAGNVAAGAVNQLDPAVIAHGQLLAVTNPLAASGGADAQSIQSVQRLAPQAFRAVMLRAVLAADYAAAAQTQAWVKRAGTVLRWTGSWLTTFTTPEPVASEQIAIGNRTALIDLLNRYRMAGTESYVPDPDYASVDLIVELCALADSFAAQVKQAVIAALSPTGPGAASAFLAISRFDFGEPLERSALEAAIQAVPGVAGVTCIHYRLRDLTAGFQQMGDIVPVGTSQILRCDNDPSRPNNGALTVIVRGGR